MTKSLDYTKIKRELKIDARALEIPIGSAEVFIERAITDAVKSLRPKTLITENDLKRAIARELQKYHTDLAYVYRNRDKII